MWTRRFRFRLRTLLLLIALVSVLIATGQLTWQYARTKAAWRAFPTGGNLEWSDSGSLLHPQYEIDLSDNPNLRDHHLATFAGLSTIKRIDISNTPLTDKCIVHLKSLTHLEFANLSGTRITRRAAKELQEALPNCTIHR